MRVLRFQYRGRKGRSPLRNPESVCGDVLLPMSQGGNGRDHNPHGFTVWFAGGGVKPGVVVGDTDELGLRAVEPRYHMRDFHRHDFAAPGPGSDRLWFLHNGRNEKLTDFGGKIIEPMLA